MSGRLFWSWILLWGLVLPLCAPPLPLEDLSAQEELEELLSQLKSYEQGGPDEVIAALREYIGVHSGEAEGAGELEGRLIGILEGEATPDAKREVCRHLSLIGSEGSIPVLERLLFDEEVSDMARYALERIPSPSVDAVLIAGLRKSGGRIRLGIISTLGRRGTRGAAGVLGEQLEDQDPETVAAAMIALGHIASQEAADLLVRSLEEAEGHMAARAAASLFRCAEAFRKKDRFAEAGRWYELILQSRATLPLRRAALKGWILTSGDKARHEILDIMQSGDRELYSTAIALVPRIFRKDSLRELCGLLPELPVENQVQLLAALSSFNHPEVREAAVIMLESPVKSLRTAALEALEDVGDGSTVRVLVFHACRSQGEEQKRARISLWNLRGEDIDPAILKELAEKPGPDSERELILSVTERDLVEAKDLMFKLAEEAQTLDNRLEAIKAVGEIGTPRDLGPAIDRLLAAKDGKIRSRWVETAAAAANKGGRSDHRAKLVEERLTQVKHLRERRLLYRVLGLIGDNASLPVLRDALHDPEATVRDTAVRAMAKWTNPTPMDDLLGIARSAEDTAQQVLALRAYIRMVGMTPSESPELAADHLEQALRVAKRNQEKLYILSMLSRFPSSRALEIAESLTEEAAVRTEALMAVQKIKASLR